MTTETAETPAPAATPAPARKAHRWLPSPDPRPRSAQFRGALTNKFAVWCYGAMAGVIISTVLFLITR